MAHTERCPICYGKGTLPTNTTNTTEDCYGCGGKGWVEVRDEPLPKKDC